MLKKNEKKPRFFKHGFLDLFAVAPTDEFAPIFQEALK